MSWERYKKRESVSGERERVSWERESEECDWGEKGKGECEWGIRMRRVSG